MKLPYLIAEIGVNHGGDRALAERMVREAAAAGVDAVKFQYYKASRIAAADSPTYFSDNGHPAKTQREFFARYDGLRQEDYVHLAQVAKECGVDFGCTVFQPEDVAWVDPLVKWHKIASADIDNWPLLRAVGATDKVVLVSAGAATDKELSDAIYVVSCGRTRVPFPKIVPLHCVLSYPTRPEEANLATITTLDGGGGGYSDHCVFNVEVLTTAWLLGATVIEKHFTLDKSQPGNDHAHSMDPADVRTLLAKWRSILPMLGDGRKGQIPPHEQAAYREARRSLYARRALPAGHVLTQGDLDYLRPAHGLRPGQEGLLIGKRLKRGIEQETLLAVEMVE